MKLSRSTVPKRYALAFVTASDLPMIFPAEGHAQSDVLLGSWKVVPERSRFEPGPVQYKSMTMHFSKTADGLKNDITGIDVGGRPITQTFQ
jgi:hypothetical protein